ncbi:MAG: hypothetical protein AAFR81_29250 [Chloroflexota bacterium]
MQETIQHTRQQLDTVHAAVRPYMPHLFQRLFGNYGLIFFFVLAWNLIVLNLIATYIPFPQSTIVVLGFAGPLLILYYGWRFMESRNHATALFVLYTQYSSQRRSLLNKLEQAENGVLDDDNPLIVGIQQLEETADSFLNAADENKLQAQVA